jgi:hypothetical protein
MRSSKGFERILLSRAYRLFSTKWPPTDCLANLGFPYHQHLKSSSPQVPAQDMQIKHAIFGSSVIREGFGKIGAIYMGYEAEGLPSFSVSVLEDTNPHSNPPHYKDGGRRQETGIQADRMP